MRCLLVWDRIGCIRAWTSEPMGMISGSQLSTVSGSITLQPRILSISTKSITVRVFLTTTTTLFNPYLLPTHPNTKGFLTELGTFFTFTPNPNSNKPTSILACVGVSFISPEQACSKAKSEIPDFDFAGAQAGVRAQWNELLKKVLVGTGGVDKEL